MAKNSPNWPKLCEMTFPSLYFDYWPAKGCLNTFYQYFSILISILVSYAVFLCSILISILVSYAVRHPLYCSNGPKMTNFGSFSSITSKIAAYNHEKRSKMIRLCCQTVFPCLYFCIRTQGALKLAEIVWMAISESFFFI